MNLIPIISRDHIFLSDLTLKHLVYFFLISNVTGVRGILISEYIEIDISDKFKGYDEDEITTCLESLEAEGLVIITKDHIQVGEVTDRRKELFSGQSEESMTAEFNDFDQYVESYLKDTRGISRSEAVQLQEQSNSLFRQKEIENWKAPFDFCQCYKFAYSAYFQERPREFMEKEYGMMKNMLRIIDRTTLVKMIFRYIFHNETYAKSLPTMNSFVYLKDQLIADVKGTSQRSKAVRTTKINVKFK